MARHTVAPTRQTLRDSFDRSHPPILTVDAGDTVVYRTLDASWGSAGEEHGGVAREIEADPEIEQGHALIGPIEIRGAEPGDVLAVEIVALEPAAWGWTFASPEIPIARQAGMTDRTGLWWEIGTDGWATERHTGLRAALNPFMGVMGNAPAAPGRHSTIPPRRVGGNMDCRELVAGSTLLLPVEVPGALFYVGDGHAAQGDGEVSGTAIECGMERVELTFHLRRQIDLPAPEAETPAGYVTMGFGPSLDEAAGLALTSMLRYVQETCGVSAAQAMALCSVAADLHVTQVVNGGVVGAHALLSPDRLRT